MQFMSRKIATTDGHRLTQIDTDNPLTNLQENSWLNRSSYLECCQVEL